MKARLFKVLFFICSALVLCSHAVCVWLVCESQKPQRGAKMVLMGLPVVAEIALLPAIGLLLLSSKNRLSGWHRKAAAVLGASALLWFAALFILG